VAYAVVFVVVSVAIGYWIHHRDTSHGDHWDWSDWLEAVLASLAAGLVVIYGVRALVQRVSR
jgi:hypothetical protein